MSLLQGHLLLAAPHLQDPRFLRTVVLVLQHSLRGAWGVVLNRPMSLSREELVKILPEPSDRPGPLDALTNSVHSGGPVPGPMIALQRTSAGMENRGGGNLCCEDVVPCEDVTCCNADELVEPSESWRLFVGHVEWQGGELEQELQRGDWLTLAASSARVFANEEDLWAHCLRSIGRTFLQEVLRVKHLPVDPSWN
ncbi:MAG: YqgE/AlgH family protein [Pirellulaceae bacterium]|nr:YqgE/AlgH family protein [Pirellulaceae bacterium]